MVGFLRPLRLPPAEVGDHFGAMGDGFQRPEPHGTIDRRGVPACPVHRTRLLLHDPQAARAGQIAVEVVVHGDNIGVANAHVAVDQRIIADGHTRSELFKETKRVGIPGRKVQITAHRPMVKAHLGDHEVVGDEHVLAAVGAEDVALLAVEFGRHVAEEPAEIEPVRRRRISRQTVGQLDFFEGAVSHGPEHRSPLRVQGVDIAVGLRKPKLEGFAVFRAVRQSAVVAGVLVVRLPSDDVRIAAIAVGQRLRNPAGLLAVSLGGHGTMAT